MPWSVISGNQTVCSTACSSQNKEHSLWERNQHVIIMPVREANCTEQLPMLQNIFGSKKCDTLERVKFGWVSASTQDLIHRVPQGGFLIDCRYDGNGWIYLMMIRIYLDFFLNNWAEIASIDFYILYWFCTPDQFNKLVVWFSKGFQMCLIKHFQFN